MRIPVAFERTVRCACWLVFAVSIPASASAANYRMESFALVSGGASSGGRYTLVGAAGGISTDEAASSAFSLTAGYLAEPLTLEIAGPTLVLGLGADSILLSWPTAAAGFHLERSSDIGSNNWVPVSDPPTIVGTSATLTVPIDAAAQFFRLKK